MNEEEYWEGSVHELDYYCGKRQTRTTPFCSMEDVLRLEKMKTGSQKKPPSRLARLRRGLAFVFLLLCFFSTQSSFATNAALSAEDRRSLLYLPQFDFTEKGDPIIRVHLLNATKTITFTPTQAIRVMPDGEGGPEFHLPGQVKYTVTIVDGQEGTYEHKVIAERLHISEREKLPELSAQWLSRGYAIDVTEVGGLFAMMGRVLDSRTLLISVFKTKNWKEARTIKHDLESRFGLRASIHSEVTKYPAGTLVLKGAGLRMTVRSPDALWVAPTRETKPEMRYTIPNIPRSYGKGYETRRYTGTLIFAPGRKGNLVGMVSLGAERLLKGVVPSEIYSTAPAASLRAQAIAARNEIYASIGVRNLADPFMQRSDVMDQVYGGVDKEQRSTSIAVNETRGQVMFRGSTIAEAFYSANSGGFTENNENVWDMEPLSHLRGKADGPADQVPASWKDGISEAELPSFLKSNFPGHGRIKPKLYRWTSKATASKARAWLRKNLKDSGRIKDIRVLSRGASGRIIQLEIIGEDASVKVGRELNVRRLFGGLKSGLFLMDFARDAAGFIESVSFVGAGFGHGVGMCQTGAMGMAKKGFTHDQILKHYYTGIDIQKLY
jgi:stage II sporulation protein D